jgi:flagellar M-ring protein FliF
MPDFRQITAKLTPRGWAMVGGSAAVALVFVYMLFSFASKPSYSTLTTGLDPAQTGKITSTLDTKGIAYQIQNNGTALAVQSDKTADARIALAGAGLLGSGSQPGFSLFDKQQLGQSNFQQQITYQRALEGQLATTIESIQGISSAQVQLVLPNPQSQLFADNSQPSTAAVLLSDSGALDSGSVKGIANLVASSVPGLDVNKVTITDSSGALLWPSAAGSGASGSLLAKQSEQAQYDATMAAQVNAMLAQTVGVGKAQVQVNADLNADQTTLDSLTYTNKGVPLTQHNDTETLKGTGGSAATGTAATIPAYATSGSGNSNYSHKTTDTTLGVDKTVAHSIVAPGKLNRQSVSILVDKSVPVAQLPIIKSAVASAVGLVAPRDTISIGQVAFAKPTAAAPSAPAKMIGYAKYALLGLGSLIFLFFVTRMIRKRETEPFAGRPTWLRELESPRPLAALEGGDGVTPVAQLRSAVNVAKRQVEDLVDREPDRVAQQVRAWMSED